MKRLFLLFVALALLCASCSSSSVQDEKFHTEEGLPDYDMQNEFAGMSVICESPEAYYFQPTISHFIWYCDKETGASGKLCGRPECTHEGKDCNAYSIAISGLNYYDQALYWVSSDDKEVNGKHYLWRMKTDGAQRQKLQEIQTDISKGTSVIRLHRGYIYIGNIAQTVNAAEPSFHLTIAREAMGEAGKAVLTIHSQIYSGQPQYAYQLKQNQMYFWIQYPDSAQEAPQHLELYVFDEITQKIKCLYRRDDMEGMVKDLVATESGLYMLEERFGQTNGCLIHQYDFQTGQLETVLDLKETARMAHHLGNGILNVSTLLDGAVSFSMMDWNGAVLQQGEIPQEAGKETYGFNLLGGNEKRALFLRESNDSDFKNYAELIEICLESEGEPRILWSGMVQ